MTVALPSALLREIRSHSEAGYPQEICGFLLGSRLSTSKFVIERVIPIANRRTDEDEARRRYLIGPAEYRAAERQAELEGLEIAGIYHSHPDAPARPSEYDLEHALPFCAYIIVSVMEGAAGETTAWLLADDRAAFRPLEITLERSPACQPS